MKRSERKLISKFTNDNLKISEDFKMKLRNQVLKQSKSTSKKRTTNRWPRMVLAPLALSVAVITALVLVIGDGVNNSPTNPLQTQKVSAAEVLQKSEEYYKSFNPLDYEFYTRTTTYETGPKLESYSECVGGLMGTDSSMAKIFSMAFNSHKTNVEADYFRAEDMNGRVVDESSRYDDTTAELDINVPATQSVPAFLENYRATYKIVDTNGHEISEQDIKATERNGRAVYELYLKQIPEQTGGPECGEEFLRAIFDAQTFAVLEYSSYLNAVSSESLIATTIEEAAYSNPGDEAALKIMSEAGFSKEKAKETGELQN